MPDRLRYLAAVAFCLTWACTATEPAAPPEPADPPNILIMVVDDMRWDDFGAAGHPFVETPNIDRLAREGARFLNAFTTTPLCSPARASLLTGQYAHTNGIIDNTERGPRSHEMSTFPRQLDDAGYDTAFVGKWHMGNDDSPRPGFDYWVSMRGQGSVLDPRLTENGIREVVPGHVTEIFTDRAVSFLERERTEPFMLYVAYKALHPGRGGLTQGGFHAPERYDGRYAEAVIQRRPNYGVTPSDKPALLRETGLPPLGPDSVTPDATIRDRMEMVLGIDESVGRLLEVLERQGQLDNTVVVFTSDHGYFYGEHGLNAERRLAFEETARIPLLVRYPGLVEGGTAPDQLVLSIDLAPTLLELGGVSPGAELQGRSLVPVLDGREPSWRSSILIEHHTDPDSYLGRSALRRASGMGYQAVRTERYKYIRYTELEGMDELYDLQEDPYEMDNLIDSANTRGTLQRMRAELTTLLEQTSAVESGS